MNSIILIGVSIAAFAANGICTRVFQLNFQKGKSDITLYQSLFCLVAGICFLGISKGTPVFDLPTLLFGMSFGIFFCLMILFNAKGYESGPMSLTGIITNMSMIIPLFYSCVVYKESITPLQGIGILLMTATIILAGIGQNEKQSKASGKWLILVIIAFVTNGIIAVIQKQYCVSYPRGQQNVFMFVAYFTSSVLFMLYYGFQQKFQIKTKTVPPPLLPLLFLSLISGIGSFGGNGISTYLSNRVNASILYPCINGGLCIALAVVSFVAFKEKFSKVKFISILLGLAAILILNLK